MTPLEESTFSPEFFRQLIDRLPVGVVRVNGEGACVFLSKTAKKYLLLPETENEEKGRNIIDFISDESKKLFLEHVKELKSGKSFEPYLYILKRSDGTKFEALVTTYLQFTPDNVPDDYTISIQDISEKRKIEIAHKESEEKFRIVFENAAVPISMTNKEGKTIICNTAAEKLTGYSKNELVGMYYLDFTYPEDREEEKLLYGSLMRGEIDNYKIEKRYVRKDGTTAWGWLTVSSVKDEKGVPLFSVRMLEDVTDKVLIENALKESQRRMLTLIHNLPGIVFRIKKDASFTLDYISEGCTEFTGYTPNKFLLDEKVSLRSIVHPDDRETLNNEINKALKMEERYNVVYRIITASGKQKWALEKGVGVDEQDGGFGAIEGIITDITDKIELLEALKESENKFRRVVENIDDGILVTDLNGKIIFANDRIFAITGLAPGKELCVADFLNSESLNKIREEQEKAAKRIIKAGWIEIPASKTDGNAIWLEIRIIPLFDVNTIISGFQYVVRDITKRKNAEEKLKASERRFRSYFELPLIGIAILSSNMYLLDCNSKTTEILGLQKEELLKKGLFNMLYREDVPPPAAFAGFINEKSNNYTVIKRFIRPDGTMVHIQVALGRVIRPDGSTAFFVALFNDITEKVLLEKEVEKHRTRLEQLVTERTNELAKVNSLLQAEVIKQKEAEEKVKKALAREKELSDLKSKFISIASHEFRTPLTTIYSSTQLLERFGKKWEQSMYKCQIDRIKEQVHNLTNTMDDVLIIGRTETGKIKYEPKIMDLKAFCDNLLEDLAPLLSPKHNLEFRFLLKKNIFVLDEKLLKHIFLNLLTNAIKYSPDGGKIKFIVKGRRKEIEFIVSDNGIGIPKKNQNLLFEPFHRFENVGEISGTGLGMSIISRSVNMHKGSISFVSEENKGSKFCVLIPKG